MLWRIIAVLLGLAAGQANAAERFEVAAGAWLALPPPGWDGQSRLPVTLFLHGAGGTASDIVDDADLREAFAGDGVLLVAPEGLNRRWGPPGSPPEGIRDETTFLDSVLESVARHYPVDPARIRIAGFSLGASQALAYACARGPRVQAVLTVAGVFWKPMPATCPGGPTNWLHIHGEADPTWPLAGRMIFGRFLQGDAVGSLEVVRRAWHCAGVVPAGRLGDTVCESHPACAGGHEVKVCMHPGGHDLEASWISAFHRWAETISANRPPR